MKNNFILILIYLFFGLIIGKEFLPFSYEIVVIVASIFVFIYLKNSLRGLIIDFFSGTKNTIKEEFLIVTQEASNYLSAEKITTFSLIEHDARNIIITDANFELLSELDVTTHLDALIISPINTINGAFNEEVI